MNETSTKRKEPRIKPDAKQKLKEKVHTVVNARWEKAKRHQIDNPEEQASE